MATIAQYDPPGGLTDFDSIPDQRAAWDLYISRTINENIRAVEREVGAGKCQFYNAKTTSTDQPVATGVIRWRGFPLLIRAAHPGNPVAAWKAADELQFVSGTQFRPQDEYLEWRVTKTAGKITRVDFTCEGPEYWEALAHGYPRGFDSSGGPPAQGDKSKLLALYRQLVGPQVQLNDLFFPSGRYNVRNKWNTTDGIVHLSQPNNTLSAEINIAARATVLREDANGEVITDADDLIRCSGFGAAERASDPLIGDEVNKLARDGFAITLLNPVGLYIDSLDTSGFTTPNGTPASQFWKTVRGAPGSIVRAVFEVPASEGYTVGDIKIGGQAIQFGGQIADRINVKLTGIACRKGSFNNALQACPNALVGVAPAAAAPGGPARPSLPSRLDPVID